MVDKLAHRFGQPMSSPVVQYQLQHLMQSVEESLEDFAMHGLDRCGQPTLTYLMNPCILAPAPYPAESVMTVSAKRDVTASGMHANQSLFKEKSVEHGSRTFDSEEACSLSFDDVQRLSVPL